MEITPKQQRNMYAVFIGLFAVNVVITVWNVRQQEKLRKLQHEIALRQLNESDKNGKTGEAI